MPAEFQVFRLVNHAHTTAPKFAEDAVMGDLRADHESGRDRPRGNVRPAADFWSTGFEARTTDGTIDHEGG